MPVPLTRPYLDGVPFNELRQLELAITPHGFLKTALAASDAKAIRMQYIGASDFGLSQFGRTVTIVSFTFLGKYKINGTIDDRNLVELVGTWFPNPVYGDMDYEMRYTEYQDFGGVKFPMLLHTHQGDPRVNVAHNYYEYRVTSVKPNAPVATMPVPDVVRTRRRCRRSGWRVSGSPNGVWLLGGGTHNSLLVEFKDYVAVVDAPNNEARSLAVIAEAARLVPGKPVQYVINTHHHFDHAGGLRTYLSQGTTIVTHETNKQYYLDILFHPAPRTLQPDRMALYNPMYWISRRPPPIETVAGEPRSTAKYVVTDGERILEIDKIEDMSYELGDNSYRAGQSQRGHADRLPAEGEDPVQCRPLLAAGTGGAAGAADARHAHPPAEHPEAEARCRAARARPRDAWARTRSSCGSSRKRPDQVGKLDLGHVAAETRDCRLETRESVMSLYCSAHWG